MRSWSLSYRFPRSHARPRPKPQLPRSARPVYSRTLHTSIVSHVCPCALRTSMYATCMSMCAPYVHVRHVWLACVVRLRIRCLHSKLHPLRESGCLENSSPLPRQVGFLLGPQSSLGPIYGLHQKVKKPAPSGDLSSLHRPVSFHANETTWFHAKLRHCSRIFSISSLPSMIFCASSASCTLLPRVVHSRCSSCAKNSKRFPGAASPSASSF